MRVLLRDQDVRIRVNLLDVVIGIAIASAVQSLVGNVIVKLVATLFGQPSFGFVETVNGTQIT